MNVVWIVTVNEPYEGGEVIGVWSSEEMAKAHRSGVLASRHYVGMMIRVDEHEVDPTP